MNTQPGYIAYFDLLGTTELAQNDHTAFFNSLVTFRNTITYCAKDLKVQDGIYFFSDCAFVETDDFDRLIKYLFELRRRMLEEGYYLVGAIGPGSLEATGPFPKQKQGRESRSRKASRAENSTDPVDHRREIVHGHFFSSDVVPVYALQNQLKGIGFCLHPKLLDLGRQKKFIVESCHLPANDNRIPQSFPDLRLTAQELSYDLLSKFLKYFYRAKLKSKKYARYYISFLVTALQSIDFGGVDTKKSYKDQGYAILEILFGPRFDKNFGDVPGVEFVYFTLLDRAYDSDNQALVSKVLGLISARRRTILQLEFCPYSLLTRENRSKLLDYLSSHLSSAPTAGTAPPAA